MTVWEKSIMDHYVLTCDEEHSTLAKLLVERMVGEAYRAFSKNDMTGDYAYPDTITIHLFLTPHEADILRESMRRSGLCGVPKSKLEVC